MILILLLFLVNIEAKFVPTFMTGYIENYKNKYTLVKDMGLDLSHIFSLEVH